MRHRLASTFVLSCLALAAPTGSHADIMVGGGGAPEGTTHPLSQFTSLAQGTMLPNRQIAGPGIQLHEPQFGIYEPNQQLIYLSDFRGRAIRVFPAFASGNVAPLRVVNPPQLGQARANAPVFAHNELGVIAGNCCIYTYPLDASGDAVPRLRGISSGSGGVTELNNPSALIYLPVSDEYAVLDYARASPYASHILFYPRSASGDVAPARRITGPHIANATGMAYDPATRRLFVLRKGPDTNFGTINVFHDADSGDASPMETINSDQLYVQSGQYFVGMGFDPYTNRLMVSSTQPGTPANNRIVSLNANASGHTLPIQMLDGTNLSQYTVGVPFGVPSAPPAAMPLLVIAHPTALAYGQTSALSWLGGGSGTGMVSMAVTQGQDVCAIDNGTLTAIGVGACTVTATMASDFSHPEQTANVHLTVVPATQAPMTVNITATTLSIGQTATLSMQGGSGTGALQFQLRNGMGAGICGIQGNTLTALAPGICQVHAYKAGDAHHYPAVSNAVTVTVMAGPGVFSDSFEETVSRR